MKYTLLLITFSVFAMLKEKNPLPRLSKLESLKEYTLTESYKGLLWGTGAAGLLAGFSYAKNLAHRFPLLRKLTLGNNKALGGLMLASYVLPQLINFKRYRDLATTNNIDDFKIKDRKEQDFSYTKYYFRPNPLKVLVSRLLKINPTEDHQEMYEHIIHTLSRSNLEELFSYLEKNKDDSIRKFFTSEESKASAIITQLKNIIEDSLKAKIENLTEDSNSKYWAIIFNLLSKTESSQAEKHCKEIYNKIESFDKDTLINTWMEISEEDYSNLIEQYELIKKINSELGTKFSDTYLNNLIEQLDKSKINGPDNSFINKFAYVFSYLDKVNIQKNIEKVQQKLKSILDSSSEQEKNDIIRTVLDYNNKAYKIIKDTEKALDHLFLFFTYFGLDVYIYAESIVYNDNDMVKKNRASIFSNTLLALTKLKKTDNARSTELIKDHKDHLVSYMNTHTSLKENEKINNKLKELEIEIE